MMINVEHIEEYPFKGKFIGYDEETGKDVVVLETICDIQRTTVTTTQGILQSTFVVYFPFDKDGGISIKRGMRFEGNMYGLDIQGTINEPYPTQMGGCEVTLKDVYA